MKQILRKTLSVVTLGAFGNEGVPCGFCPLYIFPEHEAGGIIHTKDGKAICARDRILQGVMGKVIVADKVKRDAQLAAIGERLQKEADANVLVVAEKTQTATGTKMKPRRKHR